jgi:hypothetical protein
MPLAIRLAVTPPVQALLDDTAARKLAEAMAEALQARDVPAVATAAPLPLDWRLVVTAESSGAQVLPRFDIRDADGVSQGVVPAPAGPDPPLGGGHARNAGRPGPAGGAGR